MARFCLCGSMRFIDRMEALKARLEAAGHEADAPAREEEAEPWDSLTEAEARARKARYIAGHLATIRAADHVVIANYDTPEVAGYVGANTLMEAAFAYALDKPVTLLFAPGEQPCRLEILAIAARVLDGDPVLLLVEGAPLSRQLDERGAY